MISTGSFAHAQQFGGFPPSTKWKQINTDTVRIIFTPGAEEQANRIATLIHKAALDTPFALGSRLKKVNILLQSHTTLANGYVALAPFRSEFYLVPGSNVYEFGNLPWQENLAIHEYHHVQQYANFNHGLSRGFYYLFGEGGLALANAISIPDWFFEGDAVHSETALTMQGRGRLPNFFSGYNSLWLEGKNYSWMKLRNGSFKDYVPDHYRLGYLLVNYGYLKYGPSFRKNVTQDAADFKGLFYPFQHAVKKYAGVDYSTFRRQALDFYKEKLGGAKDSTARQTKTVTNTYFAQPAGGDSIIYLKSAYNRIPCFYILDRHGEHLLTQRSISSEEWFSYRNGMVAYTAYSTRARWSLEDYSDIVVFDIEHPHAEKRITHHQKYFTPDIAPSGQKIVAIRITDSLETELNILEAASGKLLQTVRSENGYYYTNPRFLDDNRIVVGTRTADEKMSLQLYDLTTGKWDLLFPFTYHSISTPYVYKNAIFFTANFNGNDDIYSFMMKDRKMFQLTSGGFTGNYYPAVHNSSLLWSQFTAEGLQLRNDNLDNMALIPINPLQLWERSQLYPVAGERSFINVRTERFATKRYRKSTGLFNFHSWRPDYVDPEFTFSLYSDNILNTFSNEFFYRYNQDESSHGVGWNSSYGGFFPKLNAGAEYTFGRHIRTTTRNLTLDQLELRLGYNIPLNFTKGKTYKLLNFGSDYVFSHRMPTGIYKDSLRGSTIQYGNHFISWSQYLPAAVQHIFPKLGYSLLANYRDRLDRKGFQFLTSAQVFLPSFGNHSIVLSGSYQDTDSNTVFSNRFSGARGYADLYFARMWRLSANYQFPVCYPDFGFANIVYLQRLRGNLFFDFSTMYSLKKMPLRDLRSIGAELYFDTKWWNQLPLSFGVRVSHLLDNGYAGGDVKGSNYFELILPVSIIPR